MAKRQMIPTFSQILVEKVFPSHKTNSGILLVEATNKLSYRKPVSVGPIGRDGDKKLITFRVEQGGTVLLPEFEGTEVKLEDKEFQVGNNTTQAHQTAPFSFLRNVNQTVRNHKKNLWLDKILESLCISGRLSEAVGLLWGNGLKIEPETYSLLLQDSIYRKEYKIGKRIHAHMIVLGYVPIEYLKTKLLILYAKSGDLKTAHIIFHDLLGASLIPYNAMIAGYVQNGFEEDGLHLYYKMRQDGLAPDQYTFASVFRACATLATLEHGKRAHAVMIKRSIKDNVVVDSALMDMYFKCSSLSDGYKVFDKLSNRNVVTWTALISGYGHHGKVVEVLEFFDRMIAEGFRPNYVTFLVVLCACSHGGLVNEGRKYFLSMTRDYGIQPKGQHYAAIVDLLGRAGRLQEAYEFVLNSPCQGHSVIWGALLGACRIHGDMDMVEVAAKKYFELEPENSGKYVVLSNAYATFGFWNNVAEVRGMMKNSGLIKEPGYSRIEVQGEVHIFFKGDKSHKQSEEIYVTMKEITCILKDVGYALDHTCD